MSSELCAEDVMVRLTAPQVVSMECTAGSGKDGCIRSGVVDSAGGGGSVSGGGSVGGRVPAAGGAELGRRLLLAARAGDTALVLDLMAKGAPFTTDWLGTSPLHLAASNAHSFTCAVLLRAGVSRDARTKVERTPLHLAAAAGHAAVAALLLENGARVDPRDMLRMTPLHWAVERGHADVVALLLRHGADPSLRSKFRRSARDMAARARPDLLALIDAALRQRESARCLDALLASEEGQARTEPPTTTTTTTDTTTFEAVHKLPDVKPVKQKAPQERPSAVKIEPKTESQAPPTGGGGRAAALLRAHGITLLPPDHGTTVLSALQSGRSVVLSDAGKLVLKEGWSRAAEGAAQTPVKIFALNNSKLLALPNENKAPVKKVVHPQDMQVRVVRTRAKPAVKIIMNKANFTRLLATASKPDAAGGAAGSGPPAEGAGPAAGANAGGAAGGTAGVAGGGPAGDTEASLRAQLGAARRALSALSAELQACRSRLAAYEQP